MSPLMLVPKEAFKLLNLICRKIQFFLYVQTYNCAAFRICDRQSTFLIVFLHNRFKKKRTVYTFVVLLTTVNCS